LFLQFLGQTLFNLLGYEKLIYEANGLFAHVVAGLNLVAQKIYNEEPAFNLYQREY
jgi:hypothetical protein